MFLGMNNTRLERKTLIILEFENGFLPTHLPLCFGMFFSPLPSTFVALAKKIVYNIHYFFRSSYWSWVLSNISWQRKKFVKLDYINLEYLVYFDALCIRTQGIGIKCDSLLTWTLFSSYFDIFLIQLRTNQWIQSTLYVCTGRFFDRFLRMLIDFFWD